MQGDRPRRPRPLKRVAFELKTALVVKDRMRDEHIVACDLVTRLNTLLCEQESKIARLRSELLEIVESR